MKKEDFITQAKIFIKNPTCFNCPLSNDFRSKHYPFISTPRDPELSNCAAKAISVLNYFGINYEIDYVHYLGYKTLGCDINYDGAVKLLKYIVSTGNINLMEIE